MCVYVCAIRSYVKCAFTFFLKKTLFYHFLSEALFAKKWSDQCSNAWPSDYQELNVYVDGFLTEFLQRGFASLNSRAEKRAFEFLWSVAHANLSCTTINPIRLRLFVSIYTFSRLLVCVMNSVHLKSYIYRFGDGLWKRTTNEKNKICHRWCMNMWNTSQITMETVFNMLIPLNVWYGVRHHRCKEKF